MKKLIALLLALVMVLSLAACGADKDPVSDNSGNNSNDTPVNNEQTQPKEDEDENDAPIISGGVSLDKLMSAPVNPESDFACIENEEGEMIIMEYTGSSEIVVIPETWQGKKIGEIASYVFANETPVKAVKLSDSIRIVQGGAFGLNTNLEIVVCGAGLEEIGEGAFQNCTGMKELVLNDGLVKLDKFALSGMESLKSLEVPATVTDIHYSAFYIVADGFKIIGEAGSSVEEFANSEGIAFEAK